MINCTIYLSKEDYLLLMPSAYMKLPLEDSFIKKGDLLYIPENIHKSIIKEFQCPVTSDVEKICGNHYEVINKIINLIDGSVSLELIITSNYAI